MAAPAEDDDHLDLGLLLRQLWSGKFIICACVIIAATLSLGYLAITPPIYQADALLQLEEKSNRLSLPTQLNDLVDDSPRSATEIEILRSRLVLGQAVSTLHLDWQASPRLIPIIGQAVTRFDLPMPDIAMLRPFARTLERIDLELLQVPPAWIDAPLIIIKTGSHSFRVLLPNGETVDGTVGKTLSRPDLGFALRIGMLTGAKHREFTITQISEAQAIAALRAQLSVSESGRQSGVLRAQLLGTNPEQAQQVLNAVTRAYQQQNISRSAAEAQSSLEFVQTQLPTRKDEMRAAEQALNNYRLAQKAVDLSFETQGLLTEINKLEVELNQLKVEEDAVSQRYQPSHPTYRHLLEKQKILEDRLGALRLQTDDLPETQREVINLTRDLELAQDRYLQLLTRAQELRVLKASTIGNIRIIDTAQASPHPIGPKKKLVLLAGIMVGFCAGVGVVLIRAQLHSGISTSEDVEKLGLPVFATIQNVSGAGKRNGRNAKPKILALDDPMDLATEAFRGLRTSLHFSMPDSTPRSVLITSPAPNAGKSFTALNLAILSAQAGMKTCLIDADLRRGTQHRALGVDKNTAGLAEILAGNISVEEGLHAGPVDGMHAIATGAYPPNPSELLTRPALVNTLKTLDERFDLVIIDTPPVLAVADPIILAQHAGNILLVVRHRTTHSEEVAAVQRNFEVAGLRINGVILNNFQLRNSRPGYAYQASYRYSYGPEKT